MPSVIPEHVYVLKGPTLDELLIMETTRLLCVILAVTDVLWFPCVRNPTQDWLLAESQNPYDQMLLGEYGLPKLPALDVITIAASGDPNPDSVKSLVPLVGSVPVMTLAEKAISDRLDTRYDVQIGLVPRHLRFDQVEDVAQRVEPVHLVDHLDHRCRVVTVVVEGFHQPVQLSGLRLVEAEVANDRFFRLVAGVYFKKRGLEREDR